MTTLSGTGTQQTRKLSQVLMQRLAAVKNTTVAQAIRKDESTVSRIVSGETGIKLDDLQAFLDSLGYKVVDKNRVCVDAEEFRSYRLLATKYLAQPPELDWGDE
jgi:hypothetical protein